MSEYLLYITLALSLVSLIYSIAKLKKNIHLQEDNSYLKSSIDNILKSTAYNMSKYAEYSYVADMKHHQIKDLLKKSEIIDLEKVFDDFVYFLNVSISEIFNDNIRYIENYFERRSNRKPYVSIKCSVEPDNQILTLFSNKKPDELKKNKNVYTDTGLKYVFENGIFYLNNDVDKDFNKGNYKSPGYSNNKSAYKSTLIVPISLNRMNVSKEFVRELFQENNIDFGRTIYGFICIEHVDVGYFKPELDPYICYIFSEYLFLNFILRQKYMDNSNVISQARSIITNK